MYKKIETVPLLALSIVVYGRFWYELYITSGAGSPDDTTVEFIRAAAAGIAAVCGGVGAMRQQKKFFKGVSLRVAVGIILCPFFGLGIGVIASVLQGVNVDIIGVDLISKKPTMDELFFVISSYGYITAMWIAEVAGM